MKKFNQARLHMTTSEVAMGRYMRAPDHPGDGGDDGGTSSGAESQDDGSSDDDGGEVLTTEQKLEKEFGQEESPATDDDDVGVDEGEEDEGSNPDDDDDGEGEADGGDDSDDGAEDGSDSDEDDSDDKPKSRTQKRFDDLTASKREAERAAAEHARDAEYWRGVAEGRTKPDDGDASDDGEKSEDAEPKVADYEFGEADPKYVADLARHEARAAVREEQRVAGIRTQLHDMEAKYQTNVASAGEKYPDYDEVVTKGAEKQTWKCSALVSLGIRNSDVGVDVAYHLASNPNEADRISALSDVEQAQEFGRLEGRFLAEQAAAKADDSDDKPGKKPKHVSSAPKPPKKRTRGKGGKFKVAPDTDDFAAFDKKYGN